MLFRMIRETKVSSNWFGWFLVNLFLSLEGVFGFGHLTAIYRELLVCVLIVSPAVMDNFADTSMFDDM